MTDEVTIRRTAHANPSIHAGLQASSRADHDCARTLHGATPNFTLEQHADQGNTTNQTSDRIDSGLITPSRDGLVATIVPAADGHQGAIAWVSRDLGRTGSSRGAQCANPATHLSRRQGQAGRECGRLKSPLGAEGVAGTCDVQGNGALTQRDHDVPQCLTKSRLGSGRNSQVPRPHRRAAPPLELESGVHRKEIQNLHPTKPFGYPAPLF